LNLSPIEIARHLDHKEGLDGISAQLKDYTEQFGATHVALPPILGLRKAVNNQTFLQKEIGAYVFELLGFPPSVPGLRLQQALEGLYQKAGGKLLVGHEAISYKIQDGVVKSIIAKAPHREISISARAFILASGKFIGGGLKGDENGIRETIFGLMTVTGSYHSAEDILPSTATNRLAITPEGHPVLSAGLTVDPHFRPIKEDGLEWAPNLFAAGSVLAGYNYSVEKSGLGVALTSGFSAALDASNHVTEVLK
jgi:glycerol-3-phosphate dehydrogenase subunit B